MENKVELRLETYPIDAVEDFYINIIKKNDESESLIAFGSN